jgi:hypothetical protein
MPAQVIQKPNFHAHMKEKARMWKPYLVILGKDFAMFEFHNERERDVCFNNVSNYLGSYDYEAYTGGREQLVIVQKGGKG